MFRKKEIVNIGAYNEDFKKVQDYELWFRVVANNYKVINLNDALLYYRMNDYYYKRKCFNYRFIDMKVRWKGYNYLNIPFCKRYGIFIPLILGITPSCILKKFYRLMKTIDPRN
jgi:glycosyltransferase EpsE